MTAKNTTSQSKRGSDIQNKTKIRQTHKQATQPSILQASLCFVHLGRPTPKQCTYVDIKNTSAMSVTKSQILIRETTKLASGQIIVHEKTEMKLETSQHTQSKSQ